MSRIPELELERLKGETDLVALVRAKGIELSPQGEGRLAGRCPFHEDPATSFIVTPGKNLFQCVGCGAGGTVIDFVMRHDGLSFAHAVEVLRSGQASVLVVTTAPTKKSTIPRLAPPFEFEADDRTLMSQVIGYYHERLMQTSAALEYLEERGIRNEEAIETFRLGYADRTLGLRLPQKNRLAGAAVRERLTRLGLYRESGHEHFNGCLVFPLLSESGDITGIYGRKIIERQTSGLRHLYLPGPHRGLWNPAALRGREVILCGSIVDAFTFWVNGIRNAVAAYGEGKITDEIENAIVLAKTKRVWIAFGRDGTGERDAAKAAERLSARGVECRRVLLPHGLDICEFARRAATADKALRSLLSAAVWLGKGGNGAPTVGGGTMALRAVDAAVSPGVAGPPSHVTTGLGAPLAGDRAAPEEDPGERNSKHVDARMEPAPNQGSAGALAPQGDHWFLILDGREYRVGGLEKTLGTDGIRVLLRVKTGDRFHLDSLDLARDADRRRFVERAAEETGMSADLLRRDLGRLLLGVEQIQAELARPAEAVKAVVTLSEAERAEALAWLAAPGLVGRMRAAFHAAGIIGEEKNTLIAYLAGVSRLLERPLAIIVQSASAAGKTTLMDAVLAFFPEEERVKYSAMTGQSLYYLGETNLKHKILAIVEEAGAQKAGYALKLLQSEGELTIASTGKDPATGRMQTQVYRVEGPVMIMLTTTAIDLDEELQNRCLTLSVDESPEQTAKIHALQRERRTLAGLIARSERAELLRVLRNAQRLLTTVEVLNPYAPALTFPNGRTRNRRDHEKYLTLIDSIALLHQYQRPKGRYELAGRTLEYVPVSLDDIALANELAPEVLGRSLDELAPQTRALLRHIRSLVKAKAGPAFSRRELREACGWSLTQVRMHLKRLVELEYVDLRHGRLGSSFVYELLIDADAPEGVEHIGLIDVAHLRHARKEGVAGQTVQVTGGGETLPPSSEVKPPEGEGAAGDCGGGLAGSRIRDQG